MNRHRLARSGFDGEGGGDGVKPPHLGDEFSGLLGELQSVPSGADTAAVRFEQCNP